ncbi:hypothetical protein ACLMAJ_03700 [Nocardia sp. KC 131]|uniref:hypothetical protein n=1 Tax=Nocardia arseniciresistens TaxID=3392119 RepID=UPI00398F3028
MWCFDVAQSGGDGEYPVYYHHQDEPSARYLADGAWEEQADAVPDFPSFAAWFEAMAAAFTSGQPRPGSTRWAPRPWYGSPVTGSSRLADLRTATYLARRSDQFPL